MRKFLQGFTAQRHFVVDKRGFVLKAKMLTGSWNGLHADDPSNFTVLGYSIDTLVSWEGDGKLLVSTCTTTAADGWVTSGWSATARIEHALEGEELCISYVDPRLPATERRAKLARAFFFTCACAACACARRRFQSPR